MAVDKERIALGVLLNTANLVALEAIRELTRARGAEWVAGFGRRLETMVKTGFMEGASIEHEAALYDAQLGLIATFIREGLKDGDGEEIVPDPDR